MCKLKNNNNLYKSAYLRLSKLNLDIIRELTKLKYDLLLNECLSVEFPKFVEYSKRVDELLDYIVHKM